MNKKYIKIILIIGIIVIAYFLVVITNNGFKKTKYTNNVNVEKVMEAIKKIESKEPSRFSENPTAEEIYNNEYVKHIRVGLNGYLDKTNVGVEEYTIEKSDNGDNKICGLESFDNSYYKSKFIVINASDNDYGGVQADILFVDKPDAIFWIWVYRLGGDGEYVLRAFCESYLPIDPTNPEFTNSIQEMIKGSKYSL